MHSSTCCSALGRSKLAFFAALCVLVHAAPVLFRPHRSAQEGLHCCPSHAVNRLRMLGCGLQQESFNRYGAVRRLFMLPSAMFEAAA